MKRKKGKDERGGTETPGGYTDDSFQEPAIFDNATFGITQEEGHEHLEIEGVQLDGELEAQIAELWQDPSIEPVRYPWDLVPFPGKTSTSLMRVMVAEWMKYLLRTVRKMPWWLQLTFLPWTFLWLISTKTFKLVTPICRII